MWCRWCKCKGFIFGKYLNIYGENRKVTGSRNPVPRRENREEWWIGPRFTSPRHGRVETQANLRFVRRHRIFDPSKDAGPMILCGLKKLVRFRLGESAKGVKGEKDGC